MAREKKRVCGFFGLRGKGMGANHLSQGWTGKWLRWGPWHMGTWGRQPQTESPFILDQQPLSSHPQGQIRGRFYDLLWVLRQSSFCPLGRNCSFIARLAKVELVFCLPPQQVRDWVEQARRLSSICHSSSSGRYTLDSGPDKLELEVVLGEDTP